MPRLTWLTLLVLATVLAACQGATNDTDATPAPSLQPQTVAPTATETVVQPPATADDATMESVRNAGNADVTFVRAVQAEDRSWTFSVTVTHPDTGWDDYADGWDVVTPQGTVLKRDPEDRFTRVLLHPHVEEQPFTRSQSALVIPDGVTQVTVRAHDMVSGYGGQEVIVNLTASAGPDFVVEAEVDNDE
jgi:hypothetical protein